MSWADLAREVAASFPDAELLVLTPLALDGGAGPVLHRLFGSAGVGLAEKPAGDAFLTTARRSYDKSELKQETGMDRVTADLLQQRFQEDVDTMIALPGMRVI